MSRLISAVVVAAVLALAGCGDEDDVTGAQPVPAAGSLTPPSESSDAPYAVTAQEWTDLGDTKRFEAALEFIADNPADCRNADGRSAAADPVRDFADANVGTDYPYTEPVAELLAEGCAAALQSGEQDLAEG